MRTGAEPLSRPKALGKSGLAPLLRAAFVDLDLIPYPERLLAQRFNMYAQNEEDGLVLALVKGDDGGNSGFLAHELAYSGLMVDGDAEKVRRAARKFHPTRIQVRQAFVTAENVNAILEDAQLTGEIDFLRIDIDGSKSMGYAPGLQGLRSACESRIRLAQERRDRRRVDRLSCCRGRASRRNR